MQVAEHLFLFGIEYILCVLVDLPVLIKQHLADGGDLVALGQFAELGADLAAEAADLYLHMAFALACRYIGPVQTDPGNTVLIIFTNVLFAELGGPVAAVHADVVVANAIIGGEVTVLQILVEGLHNLIPHHNGGVGPGVREDDLLLLIVAAPDDGGVVGGIAGEPAGLVVVGGTGLAGHGHVAHIGGGACAVVHGALQHAGHIIGGKLADSGVALLGVVQDDLVLLIQHQRVGSGLTEYAVIGEGGIGLGHFTDGHTPGQFAQTQRGIGDIGVLSAADLLLLHQGGNTQLLGEEVIAVLQAQIVEHLDGDGVQRLGHALEHQHVTAVSSGAVLGPIPLILAVEGGVLVIGGGGDDTGFQCGSIDGQGFDRGAGGQLTLGGTVQRQRAGLFANAAAHGNDVAGEVVNNNRSGLELLDTDGVGYVVGILINRIYQRLDFGINGGIDLVATGEELLHRSLLAEVILLAEIVDNITVNRVLEVAVCGIGVYLIILRAAVGAEVAIVLRLIIVTADTFKAAVGAEIGILVVQTVAENQLLLGGCLVGGFGIKVALGVHLRENGQLALAVEFGVDIGVIEGGIIGNADDTGALCGSQLVDILGKVDLRCALHAVAALAQVDGVQIPFQNFFLGVALLHRQGAEDLLHLTVDGHVVLLGQVLDQLLGDGGGTVGGIAAHKVAHSGYRSNPVHTVVLAETLILNGDCGVDHVLGNFRIADPDTVLRGVELLQFFIFTGLPIPIINNGGLGQGDVVQLQILGIFIGFGDDVGLEILGEFGHEDGTGNDTDEGKGAGDDHSPEQNLTQNVQEDPGNSPGNMGFSGGGLRFISHKKFLTFVSIIYPIPSGSRRLTQCPYLYNYITPVNRILKQILLDHLMEFGENSEKIVNRIEKYGIIGETNYFEKTGRKKKIFPWT